MLLKITEACSMGCTHCMNDAKPDGEHMSLATFEAALDFLIRNDAYHHIVVSGGEPTEHPLFPMFMGYMIAAKEIVGCGNDRTLIQFQVSTDTRYYPRKLDATKRIWREKGFVFCEDCIERIYPMGRAKTNNLPWEAKASKCFNVRAITKQLPNPTIKDVVKGLFDAMKFCTPAIRIDGSISLGESDLCPKVASIYDKEEDIIQKIKDFKCNGCAEINDKLPMLFKQFIL